MTKSEKEWIYVLIEQESDKRLIKELIEYGFNLSKRLSTQFGIILILDDSLAFYGEVDQLASFEAKRQFVEYIEEISQSEFSQLLNTINKLFSSKDAYPQLNKVKEKELFKFIAERADKIKFLILTPKKSRGVLKTKIFIPGLENFTKLKINILIFNKLAN